MSALNLYKESVQKYLQGNYEEVHLLLRMLEKESFYYGLMNCRLQIKEGHYVEAKEELLRMKDLCLKESNSYLLGEIYFLLGRVDYFLFLDSRESFLLASKYYKTVDEVSAYYRSKINATLDILDKNDFVRLENVCAEIQMEFLHEKNLCDEVIGIQIDLTKARALIALGKFYEVVEIFEINFKKKDFVKLAQSDKNIFIFYAMESLTYLDEITEAKKLASEIVISNFRVSESLAFLNWLWEWRELGHAKNPIPFKLDKLNDSLREKAFFFLQLAEGIVGYRDARDHLIHLWSNSLTHPFLLALANKEIVKGKSESKSDRLLGLLLTGPKTRGELIAKLYENANSALEIKKAEDSLYKLISITKKKMNVDIINQVGIYKIVQNLDTEVSAISQIDLILRCLKEKPMKLDELCKAIFYHPAYQGKNDLKDLGDQVKRNLRRLKERGQKISKIHDVYYLEK